MRASCSAPSGQVFCKTSDPHESGGSQAFVINSVFIVMIVCCMPAPVFGITLDVFSLAFLRDFCYGFIAEGAGVLITVALVRSCCISHLQAWRLEAEMLSDFLMALEVGTSNKSLVLFVFLSVPAGAKAGRRAHGTDAPSL